MIITPSLPRLDATTPPPHTPVYATPPHITLIRRQAVRVAAFSAMRTDIMSLYRLLAYRWLSLYAITAYRGILQRLRRPTAILD